MSIQSFTEKLISEIEKDFEKEANRLLSEARQGTGNEKYVAGRMDGMSDSVKKIHETYKLFVKAENEEAGDESRAIY